MKLKTQASPFPLTIYLKYVIEKYIVYEKIN